MYSAETSGVRANSDRRIIQETAALLSADFPLDQLIERLCDSLAASMRATVAYVALPAGDRTVRLAYFHDHGMKKRPSDFTIPSGSHTHLVFTSGRSILKRQSSDWSLFERFALNPERPESDDSVSAMWVPVKYGDEVLGVLSVQSDQPNAWDTDDVKLLEAVARYLAIAVRNQSSLRLASRPFRGKKRTLAAIAALAVIVSAAFLTHYSLRANQMQSDAAALREGYANQIADGLERYLLDAQQLADTSAQLVATVHDDRPTVERTLRGILASSDASIVYGAGAWYEPYTFDSAIRLFGPYVHRAADDPRRIVLTYEWTRPAYNFPARNWYVAGKSAGDKVAFTEPYFDTDQVYMSAVRAFRNGRGRFAGVVTVDMVVDTIRKYINSVGHPPRSVAYILSRTGRLFIYPQEQALFAFARGRGVHPKSILDIPPAYAQRLIASNYGDRRSEVRKSVEYTGWTLVVSEDATGAAMALRSLQFFTGVMLAIVWAAAIAAMFIYLRARRHQMRTLDLELAQVELHSEIASRIEVEELLRERAYHDALTGLPNRSFFIKQLENAIARTREDQSFRYAVFFIDLDRFNVVNDSLGHTTGDRLLAALGRRIESRLHANDIVARIGGDEFVVLVTNIPAAGDATRIGERLIGSLADPFFVDGQEIFMTASLGIALSRPDYEKPEDILRDADIAMYHAKKAGRAGYQVFDSAMHEQTIMQMKLETELRRAVARSEFVLEYQPIIRLGDGTVVGFEALVRWAHPAGFTIYPDDFIPIAEQTRLIFAIGTWVLATATEQIAKWRERFPDIYVLVNVSAMRFTKGGFVEEVMSALAQHNVDPSALRLEITETAIMEKADMAEVALRELRDAGVLSQIDDFGTGYSSLSYLQRLPIEGLKIDRSFVGAMTTNPEAAEIVRAIVSLARSLKLSIIAEGIETAEQAAQLRSLNIDFGQGYYFARPSLPDVAVRTLEQPLGVQ